MAPRHLHAFLRTDEAPRSHWRVRVMAHYGRRCAAALGLVIPTALLVSPCSDRTPARAEEAVVREFARATVIEGTPQDRGRAYGKQFRDAIRDFLHKEIFATFIDRPATKEQMLEYASACAAVVRKECPMVGEEFQGIADGAGLTFDEVVLINLHEEFQHRPDLPKHGHCTAVAVAPPDTGNSHTYVGQTW